MDFSVCDCHVHVFDPKRFAYVTPRRFTPGEATISHLKSHLRKIDASQVVLIQPSVYGEDNSCLLRALNELGTIAKGVAVISEQTNPEEIAVLQAAGVCSARINLVVDHVEDSRLALNKLMAIEQRIPSHWHVQLHVSQVVLGALANHISQSNRLYVLDHMGLPDVALGPEATHWLQLLELLKSGCLYMKLSAPYLYSRIPDSYADLLPFLESLMDTRPDRLVWGSNWPHTQGTSRNNGYGFESIEPFRDMDDLTWLNTCKKWLGTDCQSVLADNANKLYQFT